MYSDPEKSALKQIFKHAGFKRFESGRYIFAGNVKTTSVKNFLKQIGAPECFGKFPELAAIGFSYLSNKLDLSSFEEVVVEWSEENAKPKIVLSTATVTEEEEAEAEDAMSFIQTLVPAINISPNAKDELILLDPHKEFRPVMDINPEIFLTLTETTVINLIRDEEVRKVVTTFNPYILKSLYVAPTKKGSLTTWNVNYYVAPAWRFLEVAPAYDGFIKKLIEHLFPNENEREYVLDWLHYSIVFRNDTVLCLIGARGTGKGILLKDILSQLIGEDYREIVNQEILTDKFNGAFKNRRYIFFDEVNVSGDRELNKFKAFCNSTIALEEKGQDSETIENFTSLGLSSNDKKDFRAEPQERRFSVPEVTETPLLSVATEDEVAQFIDRIAKPDSTEIAAFGNYLIQRKPKFSSRTPLKGRYFFNLCKLSMPEWKTFLIDFIINEGVPGEIIMNSAILKKFKKVHGENAPYATKRGSIDTFLLDYYHEGICRIGKVVDAWDGTRSRDTFAIMPNEDFLRRFGKNVPEATEDEAESAL
jgi:hypothetical protein